MVGEKFIPFGQMDGMSDEFCGDILKWQPANQVDLCRILEM